MRKNKTSYNLRKRDSRRERKRAQDKLLMEFLGFGILVPSGETFHLSTISVKMLIANLADGKSKTYGKIFLLR